MYPFQSFILHDFHLFPWNHIKLSTEKPRRYIMKFNCVRASRCAIATTAGARLMHTPTMILCYDKIHFEFGCAVRAPYAL